jgi:hypothetical protein
MRPRRTAVLVSTTVAAACAALVVVPWFAPRPGGLAHGAPAPDGHRDHGGHGADAASDLDPATGGQWNHLPPFPAEFNAVHSVAGPGGKVLLVAGSGNNAANLAAGTFRSFIWDPATGARREVHTPEDLFCSGHVLLPDGRALVAGGTAQYNPFRGLRALYAFDFTSEQYEQLTPMEIARWYPSLITAPDGRTLIVSGIDDTGAVTDVHEVFDYRTGTHSRIPGTRRFPTYPRIHLTANGRYFYAGAASGDARRHAPGFWKPFAGNAFTAVPGLSLPGQRNGAATCFVGDVRQQNLMVLGGGWPGTSATSIIKLNAASPRYRAGPPLHAAKGHLSCVNLPDGTLLEAHGGAQNAIAAASSEAALLTSTTGPWLPANPLPAGEHRLYHSMLYLLDNGQVVSLTSNPKGEPDSPSVLVFSPPYLFKGPRPVIVSAPTQVRYGRTYAVSAVAEGAQIARMALTTPPSPTHGNDPNQRYLPLPISSSNTIAIPGNRSLVPPGWYRLWAVDTRGRVSAARWLRLG